MFPNRLQPMENEAGGSLPTHSQNYLAGNRSMSKQFLGNSNPMAQKSVDVGAAQNFGTFNRMTSWVQHNKLFGRTTGSFIQFDGEKEHPHVEPISAGE